MSELLRFNTRPQMTTAGLWIQNPDGSHVCGNVMVKSIGERGRSGDYIFYDWRVFVRIKRRWVMVCCKTRSYGYSRAGVAKQAVRHWGNLNRKGRT